MSSAVPVNSSTPHDSTSNALSRTGAALRGTGCERTTATAPQPTATSSRTASALHFSPCGILQRLGVSYHSSGNKVEPLVCWLSEVPGWSGSSRGRSCWRRTWFSEGAARVRVAMGLLAVGVRGRRRERRGGGGAAADADGQGDVGNTWDKPAVVDRDRRHGHVGLRRRRRPAPQRAGPTGPARMPTWTGVQSCRSAPRAGLVHGSPSRATYEFRCQAHRGDDRHGHGHGRAGRRRRRRRAPRPRRPPTPTATPQPTASPTAAPHRRPTPRRRRSGADRTTPAPLGASRGDVTAPVVSKLKLQGRRARRARLASRCPRRPTVTIRFKRGTTDACAPCELSARAGARVVHRAQLAARARRATPSRSRRVTRAATRPPSSARKCG